MCISDAMSGTMDMFKIAPKLKTLDLSGMHTEAYIPFPADNLVLFSDCRPLPDREMVPQCLDINPSAPNLFYFSYHHYSSLVPLSSGPYHPPIVHQSLRRLSTSLGAFIDSLVVPGLTWMTSGSVESNRIIMCPRDTLSHLYILVIRSHCSLTILTFIDAIMDENLIPILQLSPQLISLHFKCKQLSRESDATLKSLFLDRSETIHVGDTLHNTLLPCLKCLEFMLYNVEYHAVKYLDVKFVDMVFPSMFCSVCRGLSSESCVYRIQSMLI